MLSEAGGSSDVLPPERFMPARGCLSRMQFPLFFPTRGLPPNVLFNHFIIPFLILPFHLVVNIDLHADKIFQPNANIHLHKCQSILANTVDYSGFF